MDNSIIIILTSILFILLALNNITIIHPVQQTKCSQTTFGCCSDGINSKINVYGTNCPGYIPQPGYIQTPYGPPQPPPPPLPQPPLPHPISLKPIGGCSGTIYGCCPNNYTPKINQSGSNCL
jgi:hypothetical protein